MKRSIRNKIIISFVTVITVIICVIVLVVSWQLHRNTDEQTVLLASELNSRTFATVDGYHSITIAMLDNILEEVRKYGVLVAHNSPIADNIARQQQESIAEYLQTSAVKEGMDFVLIFNADGELQASSGEGRGYKPGDRNLPSRLALYKTFSLGQKVLHILQEETSFRISPLESAEWEKKSALHGYVRLDPGFLKDLGINKAKISKKGALALVAAGIIRDDFSVPVGMFIAGELLNEFSRQFHALHKATNVTNILYLDTIPIAFSGHANGELKKTLESLPAINPAAAAEIHEKSLPTNIVLTLPGEKYLSTCSSIKDIDQNKVGILCTGLPENQIAEIQQTLLAHGIVTQRALQAWFVAIGIVMIVIFIILARIIASGITKPLEQVVAFTRKVGNGDFSHRLRNPAADEIGALSQSIDAMLDKLELAGQEKEQIEAHLRQSQKMEAIGTLAGGIAHDFNNILTGILGFAELAKGELPVDSTTYSDLEQIIIAGNRASDLVKQMLTFSRQEKMERISLPLNAHAKEILKLLRATIPTTIEIRQNIASECHAILANPTEVHQLLMNLCTNAAQAMEKEGGILEISIRDVIIGPDQVANNPKLSPGLYVMLSVKDTGHGIDPLVSGHIFDPFFTTKGIGKGTGMGLAVVHGIVESYQGMISVDSVPGAGATFTVLFPPAETKEIPFESGRPAAISQTAGKERILFVDDEATILAVQKRGLEQYGYTVAAVGGSVEALHLFKSKPEAFDVVISDYTMPKMTGEGLARELHRIRGDLPIILCTGYNEHVMESAVKEIGIREVVMKPVDAQELANSLRKIFDA